MEENVLEGYTDPELIQFYNDYIRSLAPGEKTGSYIKIDLRRNINMEEFGRFMRQFNITDVLIETDDPEKLSSASPTRDALFNNIPVSQLETMTIRGYLDGIIIPNYMMDGKGNDENLVSFDNLKTLNIQHVGNEPADIKALGLGPQLGQIMLVGVGSIDHFTPHKERDEHHDLLIATDSLERINWRETDNTELITNFRFIDPGLPTRENLDLVREKFPHLRSLYFRDPGEPVEVQDALEAAYLLYNQIKVKANPALGYAIKQQMVLNGTDGAIHEIVGFPDGEFVNIQGRDYYTKEDFYRRLEDPENNQDILPYSINSLADLTIEEARKIQEQAGDRRICIAMNGEKVPYYSRGVYSLDEYIAIHEKMDELLEGIDPNMPEKERFAEIYKRVSTCMYYDTPAAYPKNNYDTIHKRTMKFASRNLEALMNGKGVCAGYAFIMKNACDLMGIECEYINGPISSVQTHRKDPNAYVDPDHVDLVEKELEGDLFIGQEYHAWNQVKIDGVWYNADPTWDHDAIMQGALPSFALLSDKTLKRTGRVPVEDAPTHDCKEDYPPEELAELFDVQQPKRNIFKRIGDFLTGAKPQPPGRRIYYDKTIMEFKTGEKFEEVFPKPEKPKTLRERLAELFRPKPRALPEPEPEPELDDEVTERLEIYAENKGKDEKPPVWQLSEEAKENINVGKAVKQTEDSRTQESKNKNREDPNGLIK